MNNTLAIGLVAVLAIGALAVGIYKPVNVQFSNPANQAQVYGSAGPDQYAFSNFFGGMTVGQGTIASSTSASVTLTGNEFVNADTLAYTVNVGSITLTLPAYNTNMCSSVAAGQRRTLFIRSATTSAGDLITLASGSGFYLRSASSSVINSNTSGTDIGRLEVIKPVGTTSCMALLTQYN